MPDPTRPTPGSRPNQGALVVILAALMLVNLTTIGLLWMGGVIGGGGDAQDAKQVAQVDPAERSGDPFATPSPPDREPDATPPAQVPRVGVQPPSTPERQDASPRRPIAVTERTTQVAERTPESASAPGVDTVPAGPPLEFFGMRIFE